MAYTTATELENAYGATGGTFVDLADLDRDGVADDSAISLAQAEADALIEGHTRRLYGTLLPFSPVPGIVKAIALAETIYVLKRNRGLLTQQDRDDRRDREITLQAIEAGKVMLVELDTYPIGTGGGTPTVRVRTIDDTETSGSPRPSRDSMRGFW